MRYFTLILLLLASDLIYQPESPVSAQSDNLPESVTNVFKSTGLTNLYDLSSKLNPSHLTGDFDGDLKPDTAILVKQKSSGKIGIAVLHSSSNRVFFIGAGTNVGNGGDNFDWMDHWSVTLKAAARKNLGRTRAAALKGDCLFVEKSESASALVCWNGRRYVWYQVGD